MKLIKILIISMIFLGAFGCAKPQPLKWYNSAKTQDDYVYDAENCTIRANQVVTAEGEKANIFLNMMIMKNKDKVFDNCMRREGYIYK